MPSKSTKTNLEKLSRSRKRLRVIDLLNMSTANAVLDKVSQLPNLEKVIIICQTANGTQILHNADVRRVILELDLMHQQLIDKLLYPDDEEECYG